MRIATGGISHETSTKIPLHSKQERSSPSVIARPENAPMGLPKSMLIAMKGNARIVPAKAETRIPSDAEGGGRPKITFHPGYRAGCAV